MRHLPHADKKARFNTNLSLLSSLVLLPLYRFRETRTQQRQTAEKARRPYTPRKGWNPKKVAVVINTRCAGRVTASVAEVQNMCAVEYLLRILGMPAYGDAGFHTMERLDVCTNTALCSYFRGQAMVTRCCQHINRRDHPYTSVEAQQHTFACYPV